jgi:hypothetical protein
LAAHGCAWIVRCDARRQLSLDEDYDEAFGFSAPGISVRGGITVNF